MLWVAGSVSSANMAVRVQLLEINETMNVLENKGPQQAQWPRLALYKGHSSLEEGTD